MPAALPRVLGPAEVAGRTADGVVVGPGAGDNAAAALGLGLEPGEVAVSLGTSGAVFAATQVPTHDGVGHRGRLCRRHGPRAAALLHA